MHPRICALLERHAGSDGRGCRVAVVDTGVEAAHPDFAGARIESVVVEERFGRIEVRDGDGTDANGHGTACASQVLRVAPGASILSVRVLGPSVGATSQALLGALDWLLAQGGLGVVNLSLGTPNSAFGLEIARRVDTLYARGIPVVAARGTPGTVDFPSAFGSPVSVEAAPFADPMRVGYVPADEVRFQAAGFDVEVAWREGRRARISGSSMAAPLVAGHLARWKSLLPDAAVWELKTLLMERARRG